jgi:predicted metal-dependent HD superfamily phosphohydrolase
VYQADVDAEHQQTQQKQGCRQEQNFTGLVQQGDSTNPQHRHYMDLQHLQCGLHRLQS